MRPGEHARALDEGSMLKFQTWQEWDTEERLEFLEEFDAAGLALQVDGPESFTVVLAP